MNPCLRRKNSNSGCRLFKDPLGLIILLTVTSPLITWLIISLYHPVFNIQGLATLNRPEILKDPRFDNGRSSVLYKFTNYNKTVGKIKQAFWARIKPSFNCPKDLLHRVGGSMDGGKWTCGLQNLGKLVPESQPCLLYSFGVKGDSSFEAEVLQSTSCQAYAYDPSDNNIGQPLNRNSNPRLHFAKLGIGGEDTDSLRTLKTLMEQNGGHKWIDILKMDVESAEYSSLERILQDFPPEEGLPFGQLLIEMHAYNWDWTSRSESRKIVDIFMELERRGLRMFYKEVNRLYPNCCSEFSFINTKGVSLERFLNKI